MVPKHNLATITPQAFFRRLTPRERSALRPTIGGQKIRDLKEDLERGNMVELDDYLRQMLTDSGLFSKVRVHNLMRFGTVDEGKVM